MNLHEDAPLGAYGARSCGSGGGDNRELRLIGVGLSTAGDDAGPNEGDDALGDLGTVLEPALARALVLAAEARRWDLVARLASELEHRSRRQGEGRRTDMDRAREVEVPPPGFRTGARS